MPTFTLTQTAPTVTPSLPFKLVGRSVAAFVVRFASRFAPVIALSAALAASAIAGTAMAAELATSAEQIRPVLLASKLPAVALTTLEGKATTLAEQTAGKPVVLVFYRGGWCPYCNTQLKELRNLKAEAEKLGFKIIAISPDTAEGLSSTMGKQALDYTLLSDSKAEALKAFGIGFKVDDATFVKYQGYGIDLEKASGEKHHALPVPSVFVADAAGVIQFSYVNPDYTARIPGNLVLEALRMVSGKKQFQKPAKG